MGYKIPDEILAQATDCKFDFSCLEIENCENGNLCEVVEKVGLDVLFIECDKNHNCDFKINYGNSQICNCPVRIYLYKTYGI